MNIDKGKLYVSKHIEKIEDKEYEYELVLFATGSGVKPSWGNYPTLSGVILKNDDPTSQLKVGEFSTTWNANEFEEYDKPIIIDNNKWVRPAILGDSCCG